MISFADVVSKLQVEREYDRYVLARCLFHDDTHASMMVFKHGMFRCLACGKTGNLIMLNDKLNGKYYIHAANNGQHLESVSWSAPSHPSESSLLEEWCDDNHRTLLKFSDSIGWYLKERKVDDRVEAQRIGWNSGWFTIPVYKETQEFVGCVMRCSPQIQLATGARYYVTKNVPYHQLYVPDWRLIQTANFVVVVFGIFDALALTSLRYAAITPIFGKNSVSPAEFANIRKRIVVFPDKGEEEKGLALAMHLGWRGRVVRAEWTDNIKDPADLHKEGKDDAIHALISRAL